jgi:hypothetical protein
MEIEYSSKGRKIPPLVPAQARDIAVHANIFIYPFKVCIERGRRNMQDR